MNAKPQKGGVNCCCCSPCCSVPPAPEGGEDKTAAQTEKGRAALDHPTTGGNPKTSIPSRHVSSVLTFSEIIRGTLCQTRSTVTNGCVCAHAYTARQCVGSWW